MCINLLSVCLPVKNGNFEIQFKNRNLSEKVKRLKTQMSQPPPNIPPKPVTPPPPTAGPSSNHKHRSRMNLEQLIFLLITSFLYQLGTQMNFPLLSLFS